MKRAYLLLITYIVLFILGLTISFAQPKNEWTITTLKEYFERRLTDMALALEESKDFAKEKFENTNEWRATLENLGRTYMPRLEQEGRDKAQDQIIQQNTADIKKIENMKQGGNIVWAYVISAISLIAAIISISFNVQKRNKIS